MFIFHVTDITMSAEGVEPSKRRVESVSIARAPSIAAELKRWWG